MPWAVWRTPSRRTMATSLWTFYKCGTQTTIKLRTSSFSRLTPGPVSGCWAWPRPGWPRCAAGGEAEQSAGEHIPSPAPELSHVELPGSGCRVGYGDGSKGVEMNCGKWKLILGSVIASLFIGCAATRQQPENSISQRPVQLVEGRGLSPAIPQSRKRTVGKARLHCGS